jgi:uncharacterized membrane protein
MGRLRPALADHVDDVLLFGGLALAAVGTALGVDVLSAVGGVVFLAAIFLSDFLAAVLAPDEEAAGDDAAEAPLDVLRRRYADGELSEAEFERKVERLLETEDAATAEREAELDLE